MSASLDEPHPRRWVMLAFTSAILIGNYYVYDTPAALNRFLRQTFSIPYAEWQHHLGILYASYSLPNVVMPFVAGGLVERYGPHKVLTTLSLLVVLGAGLFAVGVQERAFGIMALGRGLLGIAGESLGVAQARITCRYFTGQELALALGINLSIARLGSVLNDVVSPLISTSSYFGTIEEGTVAAVWIGFALCVFSMLSGIYVVLSDFWCWEDHVDFGSVGGVRRKDSISIVGHRTSYQSLTDAVASEAWKGRESKASGGLGGIIEEEDGNGERRPISFWRKQGGYGAIAGVEPSNNENIRNSQYSIQSRQTIYSSDTSLDEPSISLHRSSKYRSSIMYIEILPDVPENSSFSHPAETEQQGYIDSIDDQTASPPFLQTLPALPLPFWILTTAMICFYGATIGLINVSSDFIHGQIRVAPGFVGLIMCLPDLVSTLLVPVVGGWFGDFGLKRRWAVVSGVGIVFVGVFMAWSETIGEGVGVVLGLTVVGICYAVYSSLFWPTIALLLPTPHLPTAYSLATSLLNTGLTIFPLIIGEFVGADPSYTSTVIFLALVTGLGGLVGAIGFCFVGEEEVNEEFIWESKGPSSRESGTARWVESGRMFGSGPDQVGEEVVGEKVIIS
ncbi:uncharacterized protein SPPG_01640 [Spizellomyces punctatus DAOM BR117]|uniref:Lysosomal dipeptide transporter MFSD1 n=1 Tax=Spizellomyces punctatus (strain DAOM BR117) TaxID=645134 RepID=A0A0L0HT05_SPIPD|nr:uncharacterized protein SPPG_01640 [Spizellomyces punctatus DAOM BR117]KND04207.1 hypothetical protein SPPG_01640 [Spizellomyces punctatus DAOM BR117]|eukprot:XP_016612246.1 hypothetical protein SPPG_01640 [Spizellomyces punctatus DAOM BR117]